MPTAARTLELLCAASFAIAYYGFAALLAESPLSIAATLFLSFTISLLLIVGVSRSDAKIFKGTALDARLPLLAGRLLLVYSPFCYFTAIAPQVAVHNSPDLSFVSLLFALLFLSVKEQQPFATPRSQFSGAWKLGLLSVLLLSFALRLDDLQYNAPFIDELLNFEISSIGNAYFIAADSRLWGVLCRLAYDLGGLSAARAANGLLGTAVTLFIALLSLAFSQLVATERHAQPAGVLAAFLFSLSTPALFTSALATHDALSLLFFVAGLYFLVRALGCLQKRLFLLAAVLIFFSFASRYAIFVIFPTIVALSHAPLGLLSAEQRSLAERYFYSPLFAFFIIYFAFDGVHIFASVSLGMWLSSGVAERSYPLVISALLLFTLPFVLLLLIAPLQLVLLRIPLLPPLREQRMLWVYFLGAMLLLPLAQLLKCSDFGSEKNLSYALLFAALLLSRLLMRLAGAWPEQRLRLALSSALSLLLFLLALSFGLRLLLPMAIRSEHAKALRREIAYLQQQPVVGAFTVPLRIAQQRWLSPEQILIEIRRLGLDRQKIAVFGLYGGEHTAWYLTHYLGRNPSSGEYYVDQKAPWKKNFFAYANQQQIPVLVAVLPEVDPHPFERVYRNTGYHFVSSVQLEDVDGPYGRAFILVDPLLLDRERIAGDWQSYFEAFLHYRLDIPAAAARLDSEAVSQFFRLAEEKLSSLANHWQQLSLLLEQGRAHAAVGSGEAARQSFAKAQLLADAHGVSEQLAQMLERQMPEMPPFRLQGMQAAPVEENLLDRAARNSTTAKDAAKYNARAYWLDFEPALPLPGEAMLRLEFSVAHSRSAGLRLVEQGQDFSMRGYMELLPFVEGRQVVYIPIKDARQLSRIDLQVGPEAWGHLGGTILAEVEFHSLHIVQTTAAELYLE